MNTRHVGASALMALALLSGCSDINEMLGNEDSIDYKSTRRGDPLSIPPDLTQANADPRYRAPASGSATFSQFEAQGQQAVNQKPSNANVLPQRDDMKVERDGDLRWLVIQRPPEEIFPKVVDFWTDTGFTLSINDPRAGLLETNWAENRAKIPESWLRQLLGAVLESAYDSGEREKFRTRVERVNGHTEIYISHRQMLEERSGPDNAQVQWQHGKEDPGLNAAMLARLMVYLGTDIDAARKLVAQAEAAPQRPAIEQSVRAEGAMLVVNESFDRAWRRVGVALDSGGFTVDDRDRSAGEYFVRYVDSDTGVKNEGPGFFSRLFGGDKKAAAAQYRIRLTGVGNETQVTVSTADGERDNSATAQRLLSVLKDKM
ncbi:outer membrane protein assembly factor BamC [Bordetella trematum]|uniref:outer membrane protein assembly factor BamC n=1 Tax=Bordetella trematum TaxID=123899 RepID=UPI000D894D73|nr:outer membrane protein assembly factor BamC [Bordetella trematum]SPU54371.1 lipoprotein [Bordetella trematum]VDH02811.1 lipoprotein [Bordetella trematum]